jgi:hypothetical protein
LRAPTIATAPVEQVRDALGDQQRRRVSSSASSARIEPCPRTDSARRALLDRGDLALGASRGERRGALPPPPRRGEIGNGGERRLALPKRAAAGNR